MKRSHIHKDFYTVFIAALFLTAQPHPRQQPKHPSAGQQINMCIQAVKRKICIGVMTWTDLKNRLHERC